VAVCCTHACRSQGMYYTTFQRPSAQTRNRSPGISFEKFKQPHLPSPVASQDSDFGNAIRFTHSFATQTDCHRTSSYSMQCIFSSSRATLHLAPSHHPMILQSLSTDSQLDATSRTRKQTRTSTEPKQESPAESPAPHRLFRRTHPASTAAPSCLNDSSESSSSPDDVENLCPKKRPKRAHDIFRPSAPNATSSSPRSVSEAFQQRLSQCDDDDDHVWIHRCNAFDEDDEDEEISEHMTCITE
jgi:hypothetical protein